MRRKRNKIPIKSSDDLKKMRTACVILKNTLKVVESMVAPGVTTKQIDSVAADFIFSKGAFPAFNGYNGFPGNVCVSVNDELIHGIPGPKIVKSGDIVSIDIGVKFNGMIADAARTFTVGAVPDDIRKLVASAETAFYDGCAVLKPGIKVGDLSFAIQNSCEKNGYGIVRTYVGHGVGKKLHETPEIPNFGKNGKGLVLPQNCTLAIEPMITIGSEKVRVLDDKWTVVTEDGLPCAHYENTVLITSNGCEVLTV